MREYQLVIVGGGPAGLAAACAAWKAGLTKVLILERDRELGGILNQCIHNGFGLHRFNEELTGPEYAARYIDMLRETGVEVKTDSMVLSIGQDRTVYYVNTKDGYSAVKAQSIVLAMGCRERTRGAISTPGTRCSGIFTAGAAQRYINIEGHMVGRRVVILGSGDIGLIMARRLTLEGAKVLACVELMPYSSGLQRNITQCLEDYGIPLYLSHTVTDIRGKKRLEGVTVSKVDERRNPIPGTQMDFECDTLLLSVGLIPENELTRALGVEMDRRTSGAVVHENMETMAPGVFACGNVCHVHDLVDFVSEESARAGEAAAKYVLEGEAQEGRIIKVETGDHVTYTVPQVIRAGAVDKGVKVSFRVNKSFGPSAVYVESEGYVVGRFKRDHMAPGEMENIFLPKKLLDSVKSISIRAGEVEEA